MVTNMRPPIFVRTLSKEEREALEEGLRSSEAFVLRRWQILLASARGERAPQIAKNLGCGQQTVRDAIHDFNKRGLDALKAISSRPTEVHAAFDEQSALSLSLSAGAVTPLSEGIRHTEYSLDAQGRRRGEL
jgi:hypothetical protein